MSKADQVKAAALVIAGRHDSLIPLAAVEKMAKKIPKGELLTMDCNHFGAYTGEMFEEIVGKETDFLEKHLK